MNRTAKHFDDRQRDVLTGKLVSPPINERRLCACCGLRIVKGFVMTNGDRIGEDCGNIADRFAFSSADLPTFVTTWKRQSGCDIKPAVQKYLAA